MTRTEHRFSNVLNFSDDFHEGMDSIAKLFFNIFLLRCNDDSVNDLTSQTFDAYNYSENYLEKFIHWGFALSDSGMHMFFVENLLMNARDSVLRKQPNVNCDLLGLQLSFVISAIRLKSLIGFDEYYYYVSHVVTSNCDISFIYDFFFSGNPVSNPNSETHTMKV